MFKINNKKYNMHQCFILNDFEMIFFTVKASDGSMFIAECFDTEANECYACETTEEEIFKMLDQQITMRDMFLNKSQLYHIQNGKAVQISEFDSDWIPFENSFYEIPNIGIRNYYEILKEKERNYA